MKKDIKITLLENSQSFLKEALEKAVLAETEPIQWKFAVFSMVQSIELLLKERLKREHSVLIYKNVDRRTQTVGIKEAIGRLTSIVKLKISKNDSDTIEKASELRHEIVHHEFNILPKDLKLVFAKLLGFSIKFHNKEFDCKLGDIITEEAFTQIMGIIEYAKELSDAALKEIKRKGIEDWDIFECPNCINDTYVSNDDDYRCFTCGYSEDMFQCYSCGELHFESNKHEFRNHDMCIICCDRIRDEEDYYNSLY